MKADDTNLIVEFQTEDKKYVPAKYREAVIDKIYAHIYIYMCIYIYIYTYMYSLVHPSLYSHHVSCTSICIVLYLRIRRAHAAYKLPT